MIDKEAIEALQLSEAITAANNNAKAEAVVALPQNFNLHDLEKYQPTRRRAVGRMTTSNVLDFAAYVDDHSELGATVFVSEEAMTAVAVLNLGTQDEPGHADNLAILQPKRTAAFSALLSIANGNPYSQQHVAEFMEDWPSMVSSYNEEGNIANAKAIAAIRKVTIESMRKMESVEKQHAASRSAFESVQASSPDPLPTLVYFETVPYNGLKSRLFVMRLGVRTGGDKPTLTLRVQNMEQHEEEMAAELSDLIIGAVQTIPVLSGTYQSK